MRWKNTYANSWVGDFSRTTKQGSSGSNSCAGGGVPREAGESLLCGRVADKRRKCGSMEVFDFGVNDRIEANLGMKRTRRKTVTGVDLSKPHDMSRRRMMGRLLGAAGTGMALPGLAAALPVSGHTIHEPAPAAAEVKASDSGWQPIFFDPHQSQTLTALAERIVPNSTAAEVSRFIDSLIAVDIQESQKRFLAALAEFDHEAIARYEHPFNELTAEQQNAILTDASTAEPSQNVQGRRRRRATVPNPGTGEPVLNLRDHFDNVKSWVSSAYYSSEPGMKELGWTGQVAWESLPGCSDSTATRNPPLRPNRSERSS